MVWYKRWWTISSSILQHISFSIFYSLLLGNTYILAIAYGFVIIHLFFFLLRSSVVLFRMLFGTMAMASCSLLSRSFVPRVLCPQMEMHIVFIKKKPFHCYFLCPFGESVICESVHACCEYTFILIIHASSTDKSCQHDARWRRGKSRRAFVILEVMPPPSRNPPTVVGGISQNQTWHNSDLEGICPVNTCI